MAQDGRIGRIQVGNRVVGVHAYGDFEYLVERRAARFVGLCHRVHLTQGELPRIGVDQFFRFVYREVADDVRHRVVRVPQQRVEGRQQEPVRLAAVHLFQLGLAGVRVGDGRVADDFQQLVAVVQPAGGHPLFEPFPIFRFGVHVELDLLEVVQGLDVCQQRFGTPFCQPSVVGVGAFGRGVSLDGHLADGGVRVVVDRIDGLLDLIQFLGVVDVVRIDDGLVDGEVEVRLSTLLALLDGFLFRNDKRQVGDKSRCFDGRYIDAACRQRPPSAVAEVRHHSQCGTVHPLPGRHGHVIIHVLFGCVLTQDHLLVLTVLPAVLAAVGQVVHPAVDQDARQFERVGHAL